MLCVCQTFSSCSCASCTILTFHPVLSYAMLSNWFLLLLPLPLLLLQVMQLNNAPVASVLCSLSPGLMFLGSWSGDSLLLSCTLQSAEKTRRPDAGGACVQRVAGKKEGVRSCACLRACMLAFTGSGAWHLLVFCVMKLVISQ